jgi:nitroimidazol reductase NimA-like FMN-containing flavoprotein (pyridoxamine 5'-phosphate oxidase superfamily)
VGLVAVRGAWSDAELNEFLDETAVPMRLACRTPGGGLWMLSLWFAHREGRLACATGSDADVVSYLEADPEVAFEISTNEPPYRGQGRATLVPDEEKRLIEDLLVRYLGGTDSELAARLLDEDRDETNVYVEPTKVYTWDFTERMRDAVE